MISAFLLLLDRVEGDKDVARGVELPTPPRRNPVLVLAFVPAAVLVEVGSPPVLDVVLELALVPLPVGEEQ